MGFKKGNSSSFFNSNVVILLLILITVSLLGGFIAYNFRDLKLFEKFENNTVPVTIEYYYMNNCGHCITFDPIWTKFSNTPSSKYNYAKYDINDNSEGQKRAQKFNITGTPTIIATKNNEKLNEFEGDRKIEDLVKFAELNSSNK